MYYRTYVFGKGGEDSLKASTSVNVALVKNEEGEWKVEEDGTVSTIFPRSLEKDGGTVSEFHFDNNGNLIE
ncbi:hypothetical protein ACA29_02870 [Lederbergia galactosidilytica]|uniref:Uncharacterized protein n=1 Tax=Lederbergia galactosidilytica TaxID=217031 RepID=A0A0Q9YLC3_9BACI|nr:hypothetical protein ACA29_02870 [Lederbergia galactosidilytica]